jgi:hypothetical protein
MSLQCVQCAVNRVQFHCNIAHELQDPEMAAKRICVGYMIKVLVLAYFSKGSQSDRADVTSVFIFSPHVKQVESDCSH